MNKKIYQYGKKEDFLSNKTDGDKICIGGSFLKHFKLRTRENAKTYMILSIMILRNF